MLNKSADGSREVLSLGPTPRVEVSFRIACRNPVRLETRMTTTNLGTTPRWPSDRIVLGVLLLTVFLASRAEARTWLNVVDVETIDLWIEHRTDKSLDVAPRNAGQFGMILTKKDWHRLWRTWRNGEPPEIDFDSNLVVVVTSSRFDRTSIELKREDRDLRVTLSNAGRELRGKTYILAVVSRAAIDSVDGHHFDLRRAAKPVVLALASPNTWLEHLEHMMRSAGGGDEQVSRLRKKYAELFPDLDGERPLGLTTVADGGRLSFVIFLPVKAQDKLLGLVAPARGIKKGQNQGVRAMSRSSNFAIKQVDDWLYLSSEERTFSSMPLDPVNLLEGLHQENLLAVRVRFKELHPWTHMLIDLARRKKFDIPGAALGNYEQLVTDQISSYLHGMLLMSKDLEHATFTVKQDLKDNSARLQLSCIARKGSTLAQRFSALPLDDSSFDGIELPESQISFRLSLSLPDGRDDPLIPLFETTVDRLFQALVEVDDMARPEKERAEIFRRLVLFAAKSDRLDGAASLLIDPANNQGALLAGVQAHDATFSRSQLTKLYQSASREKGAPRGKVERVVHKEVRIIGIPAVTRPWKWDGPLGKPMDIAVGVRDAESYVARGNDAVVHLKRFIDQSVSPDRDPTTLLQVTVRVFAIWWQEIVRVQQLADAKDRDRVRLRISSVPDGLVATLSAEDLLSRLGGYLLNWHVDQDL